MLPIKRTVLITFLAASVAISAAAQSAPAPKTLAGDWMGTLSAGGTTLVLVLHVKQAPNGALTATLDSVGPNPTPIPVSATALSADKLHLSLDAIHAAYDGAPNADAAEIDGTWSHGTTLLALNFRRAAAVSAASAAGTWLGKLNVGAMSLRLVLRIAATPKGLTAELQSPDQSPAWFPASSATLTGDAVIVDVQKIGGTLTAILSADGKTLSGTWQQGGRSFPLTLQRVTIEAQLAQPRPQNPVKPYPYREQQVTFANPAAPGVTLAGTLTIPPGKGPFPAVLLVAGSGPEDRDETIFGHKPFWVLADYLTRQGIVVLRYDKRGIGKSTGNYDLATTADYASDAEAGVAYLRTAPEVNAARVGLVGHSEGGIVAPMVAAKDKKVAFIVLMAGSGVPGDQVIEEQSKLIEAASGMSPDQVAQAAAGEKMVFDAVEAGADAAALEKMLRANPSATDAQVAAQVKTLESPWFRFFLTYDPATALRQVRCPVLALDGSKDLQVSPDQNLPAIRKALQEAGNTHFEIVEMPGLNHLFQTAKTGLPTEYGQIDQTMAPAAMEKIAAWVLQQPANSGI